MLPVRRSTRCRPWTTSTRCSIRVLGQLLNFTARLQEEGGVDDLAAKVQKLAADQTVRLRAGAYTDCRINHSQLKQRNLLVKELGEAAFEPLSPYDLVDLISDIEYCGILIHWQLLDASGAVLQRGDAGGVLPGTIVKAPTLTLTGADKLVLSGPLSALRCASAANDEQLAFTAGPATGTGSSVGTLTPGNDSGYLEVSDLTLPVSRLKSLAQPAGGTDNGLLVIQRTGGLCNGDFPHFIQHSVLVGFTLDFGGVQITTTSLPDATAGLTYTAALKSAGGGSTLTWSATGLPAGLDIDPQTGVISGRPVTAGTASVAVTVTSGDGSHATRTFSLVVKTSATLPPGTYALNLHIDCPSFLGGRIQSVFSGSVVLAPAGGQVTAMFSGLRDGGACLANTQVNGLLSASITTDASGTLALTSVSITPTIDASATAHGICPDVTVQVAGPVSEGPGHLQFNGDAPPLASQCFNFNYTGFDVNFVSP